MSVPGTLSVIVCGGRDYSDRAAVREVLDSAFPGRVIEGGCRTGADVFARQWARDNDVQCDTFFPDWERHGRAAGPMRNRRMLDEKPDLVFAFPGGRGTADMVRQAKRLGIRVEEIAPRPAVAGTAEKGDVR